MGWVHLEPVGQWEISLAWLRLIIAPPNGFWSIFCSLVRGRSRGVFEAHTRSNPRLSSERSDLAMSEIAHTADKTVNSLYELLNQSLNQSSAVTVSAHSNDTEFRFGEVLAHKSISSLDPANGALLNCWVS